MGFTFIVFPLFLYFFCNVSIINFRVFSSHHLKCFPFHFTPGLFYFFFDHFFFLSLLSFPPSIPSATHTHRSFSSPRFLHSLPRMHPSHSYTLKLSLTSHPSLVLPAPLHPFLNSLSPPYLPFFPIPFSFSFLPTYPTPVFLPFSSYLLPFCLYINFFLLVSYLMLQFSLFVHCIRHAASLTIVTFPPLFPHHSLTLNTIAPLSLSLLNPLPAHPPSLGRPQQTDHRKSSVAKGRCCPSHCFPLKQGSCNPAV